MMNEPSDISTLIRRAFHVAQSRRPYTTNDPLLRAILPPGGDWRVTAAPGAVCRSVMWGTTEVAHVNPRGQLDDGTEADIAMGLRAVPLLDAAMRCILVLAEDVRNLTLIREIAMSAVAFVEMPAPVLTPEDRATQQFLHPPAGYNK